MTFDKLVNLIAENKQEIVEEGYKETLAKIALLAVAGIGWKVSSDLDRKVSEIEKKPGIYYKLQKEVEKKQDDPVFTKEIIKQYTDKVINKFNDRIDNSKEVTPIVSQTPKKIHKNLEKHEEFMTKAKKYISANEISEGRIHNSAYRDVKKLPTIGIGHLIIKQDFEDGTFKPGEYVMKNKEEWKSVRISDARAKEIFQNDLDEKLKDLRRQFLGFDNYPEALKIPMLDGFFRGDLAGSPNAKALIKKAMDAHFAGKQRVAKVMLKAAAKEYLDSKEYRTYSDPKNDGMGIAIRMRKNALQIENALLSSIPQT